MHWRTPLVRPAVWLLAIASPWTFLACQSTDPSGKAPTMTLLAEDPHSYSQPQEAWIRHLSLDLNVDFEQRQLVGSARLDLETTPGASSLHLDTRDLTIRAVRGPEGEALPFKMGTADPHLGSELKISLPPHVTSVTVDYTTAPEAGALQWLEPSQTAGGKHPFLFTQSQAILARTWVPCQDTPAVRFTYDATVRVPPALMALMSAENPTERSASGEYTFRMDQPIPSYLLALAVGEVEFRALGPRSGVYAEPEVVDKAAWEFADTESMIAAAEELYGPYRWDRYDVIVLPPSFPFGGMENPRLTFATPTILAGDRSLMALIAHELAHSWSGNLVTNATWNDFWLNEGFTVYFEHRIMEALYGRDYDEMLALLGQQSLRKEIEDLPTRDTWLHLDLAGRDPDDGMTDVAYEKGYFFLRMLEETLGREAWDEFLRAYFDDYAFQSMTTERFLGVLSDRILAPHPELAASLNIEEWVHGPGLPANCPQVHSTALRDVSQEAEEFLAGKNPQEIPTKDWSTHHWLHFLRSFEHPLSAEQMAQLDAAYKFTSTGNSEILHDWCLHAIASQYEPAYGALRDFLVRQGRRKFLKPLYKKLAETPEGLQRAKAIYEEARDGYHPVSQLTIDEIVGYSAEQGS